MPVTETPTRIVRSRRKGWRLPPGCVCVTRPGKWGNPFRVFGRNEYLYCDASHRRKVLTPWVIFDQDQDIKRNPATPAMAVEMFRRWLTGEFNAAGVVRPCELDVKELRGWDVACWCKIGSPRHGDVLLEFAAKE